MELCNKRLKGKMGVNLQNCQNLKDQDKFVIWYWCNIILTEGPLIHRIWNKHSLPIEESYQMSKHSDTFKQSEIMNEDRR